MVILHQGVLPPICRALKWSRNGWLPKSDGTGDLCRAGLGLGVFEMDGPIFRRDFRDPFQFCQEIQMPVPAAEFSIGDGMEPHFLLWPPGRRWRHLPPFSVQQRKFSGSKRVPFSFRGSWTQKLPTISYRNGGLFFTVMSFFSFVSSEVHGLFMGKGYHNDRIGLIPKKQQSAIA